MFKMSKLRADKVAFFTCLTATLSMLVGGFFVPPMGVIDGSVLTATGILLGFATLAVGAQAICDGKMVRVAKGDAEVSVGKILEIEQLNQE